MSQPTQMDLRLQFFQQIYRRNQDCHKMHSLIDSFEKILTTKGGGSGSRRHRDYDHEASLTRELKLLSEVLEERNKRITYFEGFHEDVKVELQRLRKEVHELDIVADNRKRMIDLLRQQTSSLQEENSVLIRKFEEEKKRREVVEAVNLKLQLTVTELEKEMKELQASKPHQHSKEIPSPSRPLSMSLPPKMHMKMMKKKKKRVPKDFTVPKRVRREMRLSGRPVRCTFATSGSDLVVGCENGKLLVVTDSLKKVEEIEQSSRHSINCLSFSRNDAFLLSTEDNIIRVWNWQKTRKKNIGHLYVSFTSHKRRILDAKFCGMHRETIVSTGFDRIIKLWDVRKGREMMQIERDVGYSINSLKAENALCYTGHKDGKLKIFDLRTGKKIWGLESEKLGQRKMVEISSLDTCYTHFFASGRDSVVTVFDTRNYKQLFQCSHHQYIDFGYNYAKFTPTGTHICCGSKNGNVAIFSMLKKKLERCVKGHEGPVISLDIQFYESTLVSCGHDKTLAVYK